MKLLLALFVLANSALAQDAREFHKSLLEDVQKEVSGENDFNLKADKAPLRAPASVTPEIEVDEPETKVEKKDRQLGGQKW
jgi:hypothetical protein